jgi:hypothetical protein
MGLFNILIITFYSVVHDFCFLQKAIGKAFEYLGNYGKF